jgi:phenylacetate-CoA ligase
MIGGMTRSDEQAQRSENERRRLASMDRQALAAHQLRRLNLLLDAILPANAFYAQKLAGCRRPVASLAEFAEWPLTSKDELASADLRDALAVHRTFDRTRYSRWHQTSGTRGRPMAVLDTADDWHWWIDCWQWVLDAAELGPGDCAVMAFSFGPFIGFWSAYEAAAARGCLVVPAGGMNTAARLELLRTSSATAVFCTPSYALHMAEVAAHEHVDLASLPVRRLVVAGEPGGSIPAVRNRIEAAWGATVIDHAGATEVGPWGCGDARGRGLFVLEHEFIAEFRSVASGGPADEGELSELIVTSLGRVGYPAVRYRTGDLVRPVWSHGGATRFVLLEGGVVGRADDMLIVRGVNVFPTAIEQIVRGFPEVVEYRVTVRRVAEMDELSIEIEDRLGDPKRVADELRLKLGLRVDVCCAPLGSLPRFEGKGRRLVDQR